MLSEVLATDNRDNIMLNVVGCRTTEPTPQAQPGGSPRFNSTTRLLGSKR